MLQIGFKAFVSFIAIFSNIWCCNKESNFASFLWLLFFREFLNHSTSVRILVQNPFSFYRI